MDNNMNGQDNYWGNQPQQPQVVVNMAQQDNTSETVSVKDWLITMLILCIPCAGFIMIFVWAFSDSTPKSKANYFKASLLMSAIVIALYIILFLILMALSANVAVMQG